MKLFTKAAKEMFPNPSTDKVLHDTLYYCKSERDIPIHIGTTQHFAEWLAVTPTGFDDESNFFIEHVGKQDSQSSPASDSSEQ